MTRRLASIPPRNSPVAKKNGVGAWLLALALGVAVLVTLISPGTIVINPVAVASVLVYVIAASVALYFIWLFVFAGLNRKERARLLVCFILLVSAAFFWSAFEQKPTSFNLFANDYTNRMIGDFEIPAVWFQSINALFIILLAPVFSWAWPALARKNVRPGSMTKFVIGILCAAAGFGLMMLAAQNVLSNGGAGVSPLWLVGSILMLTLGELCLSPIGLATMTLLAPERMRGQMMGLWFCASALGNLGGGPDRRSCEGRSAVVAAGPLRPLLHRIADLRRRAGRADCPGPPDAGEQSVQRRAKIPQQRLTRSSGRPYGAGLFFVQSPPQQNKIPFSQCAMSHNVSVFFEITSLSGP